MKTVVFNVEGMTCGGCAKSVTRVLTELSGVQSAQVNHSERKAEVVFDETVVTEATLIEAIEDAGFEVIA